MDKRSREAINWLYEMFEEPLGNFFKFHEYLWPYAALLEKIATIEGLKLSDDVYQMLNNYPDGVDEPYPDDDATTEEKLNQMAKRRKRRMELIRTMRFHIDELDRIAEEQRAYNHDIKKGAASGEQATPQGDAKS
mgnify:CR=1 FL=1